MTDNDPAHAENMVFIALAGLGASLDQAAGGRFTMVGPWRGPSEEAWWAAVDVSRIRVAVSSGIDIWDKALLHRLPNLHTIVVYGAGQAGIDLEEIARRKIRIVAASVHATDVAEHAVAMILAGWRRIREGDDWIRRGDWEQRGRLPMTRRLAGRRVGIVGLGHIGREIAQRMEGLGCHVEWWGPREKPDVAWPRAASLQDMAERCDVLAVAAFAHEDTRGLISNAVIRAVGRDGLLLNVSRGMTVDEDALIAALSDGGLGYAALDVFTQEPTPAQRWADVPNCILTPHSAGTTIEASAALKALAVANVEGALGEIRSSQ